MSQMLRFLSILAFTNISNLNSILEHVHVKKNCMFVRFLIDILPSFQTRLKGVLIFPYLSNVFFTPYLYSSVWTIFTRLYEEPGVEKHFCVDNFSQMKAELF